MENTNNFTWWISSNGYEWVGSAAEEPGGKRRSPAYPALVPVGGAYEAYQPPPQLFLEFCRLDVLADDAILKFANRYGALGGVASEELTPEEQSRTIEPRGHWRNQAKWLNRAIQIFSAIKAADTEYLATILKWASPDRIELATTNPSGTIASSGFRPHLLKRCQPPDLILPGQIYLEDLINENIDAYVPHKFRWVEGFTKLIDGIRPNCLLGFFWLQFAVALQQGRTFSHCEVCSQLMLSAPEHATPSAFWKVRKTCSNKCRVRKSYEARKGERLQEEAVPLEEEPRRRVAV
jgi:hypothetical protein